MNLATPSRFSLDWNPSFELASDRLVVPAARRKVSRDSFDWRGISGAISTAELYAQQMGIPVPQWAKQGIHWRDAIGPIRGMRGFGDVSTQQISSIAATGASTTVGILTALGTISGPWGAAIAGLIGIGQALVGIFSGCGQTCVEATKIANQVGDVLAQNVEQYVGAPVRTVSMQAAALNNFMTAWKALVANCQNPQLLAAGQRCISDRQQGSCAYKTTPGGWNKKADGTYSYTWPGANGSGSTCWNYWVGFHDPIANDPDVQPDPVLSPSGTIASGASGGAATGGGGSAATAGTPNLMPLLLIGGAIALAALL